MPRQSRGERQSILRKLAFATVLAVGFAGCSGNRLVTGAPESIALPPLKLQAVATGLPEITVVTHAGDGSGRLFLATQSGLILTMRNGRLELRPFADLREVVKCCGEQGLLGLALDPDFRNTGRFYVTYTDADGATIVARYVAEESTTAPRGEILLRIEQPTAIHNGGALAFGVDGYLYIAVGDGGHFGNSPDHSGRDPQNHGQRLDTLLGKILRIDVAPATGYRIPPENPYRSTPGALPEIWASGLRNPWRMSIDRRTGDLFIADVGPSSWEEINLASHGVGGLNFGWNVMLGPDCFSRFRCADDRFTTPVLAYGHDTGCAVIGGYRYRGKTIAGLDGIYLYSDFCSGAIWGGRQLANRWEAHHLLSTDLRISTFGEDETGEVYVVHYGAKDGAIYRLVIDTPR